MRLRYIGMAVLLLAIACMAAQGQERVHTLSDEEQAWVRAHPVLRLGLKEKEAPFEFRQRGGSWVGLTPAYLKALKQHSGLTFEIVTIKDSDTGLALLRRNSIDLLPMVRTIGLPPSQPGISYSLPYIATKAIAVTREESPDARDMLLNGKTVVLASVEAGVFSPWLHQRFDNIHIVIGTDMQQALTLLSSGAADVAIGSEAQVLPDLQLEHGARLRFSTLPIAMTSDVRMALRDSDPLLASIVNKSLASMSSTQIRLLHRDWLGDDDENMTKIQFVAERYGNEVAWGGALLLLIAGLAYQAYREHRRALRSERKSAMFLAVMSHEIRSPLNAVLAAVELLRFTTVDAQQKHLIDLANNGANTLLRLLDDVLDVSKLEAQQLTLSLEGSDVVALANGVAALQQLRAQEKGISLSVTVLQAPPLLMIDETRLLQVLHNLVSNAIKFTETGGVEIQIAMPEGASGSLEISVADTGIGISAKAQASLFRPYAQVAGTYKRSGGTGLGLLICRELVDLMQGTIVLDSVPGKGTKITIVLPVEIATEYSGPAPGLPVAALHGSPAAPRLCILVIEDVPANQAVLRSQLASLSCDAEIAGDGASALACFNRREYDLVLMDCDLPDIDGYSLAADWRVWEQQGEQARCPIIAISASTGQDHVERCFTAGMDGILSKPIRLAKLQGVIELWCDVSLAPGVSALNDAVDDAAVLGMPQVRAAIACDVSDLLQALALRERDAALRAAHRLHGAALAMQWTEFAQQAGELEQLLRGVAPLGGEQCQLALLATVRAWRASDAR